MDTTRDTPRLDRSASLLHAEEVSYGYGSLTIVDRVSIEVGSGEIVVLLGPNGAGKSTFVKGVIGHLPLLTGAVRLNGDDISRAAAPERVRLGVGYVPQIRDVFSTLTVWENLRTGGYLLSRNEVRDRAEEVLTLFPALARMRRRRAGTLSGGERKMLAIGRALMTHPSLLILDEPTSNLAPAIARMVLEEIVGRVAQAGQAVLMVEQRVEMALGVASFGYVLTQGRVRMARDAQELRDSEDELSQLFFSAGTMATNGAGR